MADKFSLLKKDYPHVVPAEALFFNVNGRKALRLEVPEIGKEFTDGLYIGKDPEGSFYYKHLDSLDPSRSIKYKSYRYINPFDNKVCCWIRFYTTSEDSCHAEFLGYDPDETVRGCSMDNYQGTGKWKELVLGSATASIRKYDDENTLTITVGPLRKKAVITDSINALRGESVDVQGLLHFKDVNAIASGAYASYNDDRIVFYQNTSNSTDFTAFFVPFEGLPKKLGIQTASTKEFSSITWSNI
ncbi:hypothetical protein FS837_001652 [Tulasnella sp. UAMH 9824]|nr:hypothetical protein FS837_001652 [Tulasnella sp. UAMH 9824]